MLIGTTILLCAFAVLVSAEILFTVVVCTKKQKKSRRIDTLREIVLYCQKLGYGLAIAGLAISFISHII
jgi:hypothetical protein